MPSTTITMAVLLVVLGGVVAGLGDLSFDPMGYTFALLSCATQAAYLLLVEFQVSSSDSASCVDHATTTLFCVWYAVCKFCTGLVLLAAGW